LLSSFSFQWYYDSTGHGTHVTGTIAARRNGFGVVGVAPEATVLTYRVLDTTGAWAYSSTLAQAALNCYREGAKVINMSLGGPEYSSAENDMFRSLYSKGVVSVAASGNDGGTSLMYPASYLEVVSVAAVDSKKKLASFSQRNSRVDLSAHGVAVASTLPWWMGDYGYLDGTSMACPHVAGVAALLFSKRPSASAATIVNAMTATAQDLGPSGRDSSYGSGLVNALAALSRV
jgi:serine protease